jgi:hypothetical protein
LRHLKKKNQKRFQIKFFKKKIDLKSFLKKKSLRWGCVPPPSKSLVAGCEAGPERGLGSSNRE